MNTHPGSIGDGLSPSQAPNQAPNQASTLAGDLDQMLAKAFIRHQPAQESADQQHDLHRRIVARLPASAPALAIPWGTTMALGFICGAVFASVWLLQQLISHQHLVLIAALIMLAGIAVSVTPILRLRSLLKPGLATASTMAASAQRLPLGRVAAWQAALRTSAIGITLIATGIFGLCLA